MSPDVTLPAIAIVLGVTSIVLRAQCVEWNRRLWGMTLSERQRRVREWVQIGTGVCLILFGSLFLLFRQELGWPEGHSRATSMDPQNAMAGGMMTERLVLGSAMVLIGTVTIIFRLRVACWSATQFAISEAGKNRVALLATLSGILLLLSGVRSLFFG